MSEALVVGAGPAGAVVASRLARAGVSITCLEQGSWQPPESFPARSRNFELLANGPFHPDPNVRRLAQDYPVPADSPIAPLMFNAVGGSALLYAADWCRLRPSDFRVRSLDGVADDWPIDYDTLAPYYEQTDREFGIAGLGGDPSLPAGAPPPRPALPIGPGGRVVAHAHDRLGWHWWPGTNAIGAGCTQWGACIQGCPVGAKATPDLTHWPRALADGAELVTGARVRRVLLDGRGRASGVEYVDRDGREHERRAPVVVLAANGIGTPRLLLMSKAPGHPDGLANSSGLVGKRLMLHPFATVEGVFPELPRSSWIGHAGPKIVSYEHYETDAAHGFPRGAKWSLGGVQGPVSIALGSQPPAWGPDHHEQMQARLGRTLSWAIFSEDLPDVENVVTLAKDETDSDGLPAARVRYCQSEENKRLLAFHVARARESLLEAGAGSVSACELVRDSGWHLLGTARMGEDPASSVVNGSGAAHDVPGLHIADGSVFVTSAGVNPTSTIVALAARLADRLIATRGRA